MDIIPDILSEIEVLGMSQECLEALLQIFNTPACDSMVRYLENPEADKEVVDKLMDSVGDELLHRTFHLRVRDKGIQHMLYENNISALPMAAYRGEINLDDFIAELQWLDDHSKSIRATIPGRTKDMYDQAYKLIQAFQKDTTKFHDHQLPALLHMYKNTLFCPLREKPINTGMRNLSVNKQRWHIQLRAALYLKYCIDNNIPYEVAREC